jgi:hypothetical protein
LNHLKGQLGTLDRCDIIAANLRRQAQECEEEDGLATEEPTLEGEALRQAMP